MSEQLKNAPVFLTLAQIIFEQQPKLLGAMSTIQSSMKTLGFPDYFELKSKQYDFKVNVSPPEVKESELIRHRFTDVEQSHCFILTDGSLSYLSTEYQTYDSFVEQFCSGLKLINEQLELSILIRLGLRYFDKIYADDNDLSLKSYINPNIFNVEGHPLGGDTIRQENIIKFDNKQLTLRFIKMSNELVLPSNVSIENLIINSRFREHKGDYILMDTDSIVQQRQPFDQDEVKKLLDTLHEKISNSFKNTVTTDALKKWSRP